MALLGTPWFVVQPLGQGKYVEWDNPCVKGFCHYAPCVKKKMLLKGVIERGLGRQVGIGFSGSPSSGFHSSREW